MQEGKHFWIFVEDSDGITSLHLQPKLCDTFQNIVWQN
jgi:hypothetical protein